MRDYQSSSHTKWNCKYHVVFIPKRRRKVMFGQLRKHLGEIFHELAKQKGCEIVEGHLLVTPETDESLSCMMRYLGSRYVQYVNHVYRRSGTLWEGRYKPCRSRKSFIFARHYK